jgi:hypothetical protein
MCCLNHFKLYSVTGCPSIMTEPEIGS